MKIENNFIVIVVREKIIPIRLFVILNPEAFMEDKVCLGS
jgi:hypothetical protein